MFDTTLYLAELCTKEMASRLSRINGKLISLLELEQFEMNGFCYIGKKLPPFASLEELNDLGNHLQSVMKRLELKAGSPCLIAYIAESVQNCSV